VDHEPSDRDDILRWIAEYFDMEPRARRAEAPAGGRPTRGNKRCKNDKIRRAGYVFQYPTYREGCTKILSGC